MQYLGNAFSIQMLKEGGRINIRPTGWNNEFINSNQFRTKVLDGRKSIIGHKDLATVLGVEFNRENVELKPGDSLLVAQVIGGRLPEGTTVLPIGFDIEFFFVDVECELKPWGQEVNPGSIYGGILGFGKLIASKFNDGEASGMKDAYNNFIVEIKATGFHGTLWDD